MTRRPTIARSTLFVVLSLTLASAARADMPRMTPGLWEQSVTMKSQGGEMEAKMAQMQAQLASMPPEQRAMVEKMMASRGVQMGAGGTTLKVCISKDMADNPTPPRESHCEQQQMERSGSTVKYKFSCAGENGRPPTTGEGTFTMTSATSYTGTSVVNTMVQGKAERIESTITGRYLGSDCGTIQPIRPSAR